MNNLHNKRQQTDQTNPSKRNRLLGATIAVVLVAWWGIHFNAVFQAVRAANETQLQIPTGTHTVQGSYTSAEWLNIDVYGIGIVIILCSGCFVWPLLAFVPRRSSFWRFPILVLLGISLPLLVVIAEAWEGSTRPIDKWSDAGLNHLLVDIAGYLTLGLTYGIAVWFAFKTYILRPWSLLAWSGIGFAAAAVPASCLLLQQGNGSWAIAETLFCVAGGMAAGLGWLAYRMATSRSLRAG